MNHKYCSGCGVSLIRDKKPYGYSSVTGDPYYRWYCPNLRLWNFWFHIEKYGSS